MTETKDCSDAPCGELEVKRGRTSCVMDVIYRAIVGYQLLLAVYHSSKIIIQKKNTVVKKSEI